MVGEFIVKNFFYFFTAPPVKPLPVMAQAPQMNVVISSVIMIIIRENTAFICRGNGP